MAKTIMLVFFFGIFCRNTTCEVHKYMTLDEVRSTFYVDSHHLVPEYELVTIRHITKRSISAPNRKENSIHHEITRNDTTWNLKSPHSKSSIDSNVKPDAHITELRLKAFGTSFNLNLVPTEGLYKKGKFKLWSIEPNATDQHGIKLIEHPEADEDIGDAYQDEKNQAAVLLRKEDDKIFVEGSIGSSIVIRPLPIRLRDEKIATRRPNNQNDFWDVGGTLGTVSSIETVLPADENGAEETVHHHIVFKRKESAEDVTGDYAFMEPDHLSKRFRRSSETKTRKKREAPYTIYPEILVIVDYDGYRLHGGDNVQIKRYFVSFWNGVDMRYKLLKGPKIRVSIAGIIISRGRDATPYLERNRVGRDAIDSAAALTDMGKYLFRERRLPVYDIAVAITKLDMCRRTHPSDNCNRGTAGFAYVGGACVVNKRLEKVNSVAIIEDTGGFSGIIVAAHEVGHLLGAVHDGSPPPSYLGGPGAEKCKWTDGFIMSDLRHTERGFRWSPCSVSSFHHFLNGDTATCLYNEPHEDASLPRVLPGKLLTLDAQCRRDRGTSACFKDDRVCAQLFCFDSGSGYCVAYRPAAEGSACGDGQHCLNGRCVAEHENIIPDYSQNSATYVRANENRGRPLFDEEEEEKLKNKDPYFNDDSNYYNPTYGQNYQNNVAQIQTQNGKFIKYENQVSQSDPSNKNSNTNFDDVTYKYGPEQPSTNLASTSFTRTFSWSWFTISTTKSPYDFKNFGKNFETSSLSPSSTQNPVIVNFYSFMRSSTKNPYDFTDFGKTSTQNSDIGDKGVNYDNVNNNHLKRK
ncbi:A disintegrin and metalloproteinase with thrombospondin motifs like isoform X2 [Cylas formicarius]|uniref:A disintegrin and metalloproteinase with thrombospondin motifs like isoform X2 n=1 Tax=Cylas formicarius TaxID=197179 RepID=UPI002958475C|nr:A disintegrin and metalloproteinase with thrombospondin motifs like isoform X2 [Cylas formicarius]